MNRALSGAHTRASLRAFSCDYAEGEEKDEEYDFMTANQNFDDTVQTCRAHLEQQSLLPWFPWEFARYSQDRHWQSTQQASRWRQDRHPGR